MDLQNGITEEAIALHRSALVIDSHNDAIVAHIRRGNVSMSGQADVALAGRHGTVSFLRGLLDTTERDTEPQVNFPKLRVGGIDAAFFSVDVTPAWHNHMAYALDAHGFFAAGLARHSHDVMVALSARDIQDARAAGKLAAVLAVENSDALDGSINALRMFYQMGIRSMTLTHSPRSIAADGVAESRTGGGLTEFGMRLVREMNALGVQIDVSHLAERGFWEVLELSERPVIASHSCCAALCPHPRNLTDDQIRALRNRGGLIALTFVPYFIAEEDPSVERLLDHVEHALQVAGPDHVGIGSDFDGGGDVIRDATEYPLITQGLLDRGHSAETIRKVLGENQLRVFEAAVG